MTKVNDYVNLTLAIIWNLLSVVGVVICNKYIVEIDEYKFIIFLTLLHVSITALCTEFMLVFNTFKHKKAPFPEIVIISSITLLSVAFMNLNLSANSIGFYQVWLQLFC